MDPLYEQLLVATSRAQRLEEAICQKYGKAACEKAKKIRE
jgi:hypothetical protein